MEAFDLYTKLLNECDKKTDNKVERDNKCAHANILVDYGCNICGDCGTVITEKMDYEKEWRYYGMNDAKSSDPSRCKMEKVKDKTIYQDVQHMNISNHIKDTANDIYVQVCNGKTHRGAYRKAIVFASVFHAYKIDRHPQSCETLIKIFEIKRKDALKGLKFVNENAPKNSPIRTLYITPEDLIEEFLRKFSVSNEKRLEILDLYSKIKNKSSMINRSRPQSIGASVVWYWLKLNKSPLSLKEFVKKVGLSELTVTKLAKEIAQLHGHPEVMKK